MNNKIYILRLMSTCHFLSVYWNLHIVGCTLKFDACILR